MYQDVIYGMYHNSLRRAQESGLEHTITVDWIKSNLPTHCKYTKNPLTFQRQHLNSYKDRCNENVSIDRIDSSRGYTEDNVQFISFIANILKKDMSEEEFLNKFPQYR